MCSVPPPAGAHLAELCYAHMQGHPYAWPAEDLLLTTITRGSCKTCGFFEERLLPFVRVRLRSNSTLLVGLAASRAPF